MNEDVQGRSVLIADDAPENLRLLTALLRRGGLVPRPVISGRLAIEAAVAEPPDLMLLDVRMPEMSGLDVCRWFKQDERLCHIPILFISGLQDTEDKVEAFRAGGVDFISKPFHGEEVLARVQTHLHLRHLQRELEHHNLELERRVLGQVNAIAASQMSTIFALAKLAEARDDDTGHHIERVQTYSKALAERLREVGTYRAQLTPTFIEHLFQTASLHDIGKVGTPDAVLLKPGRLTTEEFAVMQKHCALGADTLGAVLKRHPENQFLRMGVHVARSHHERWDGRGYPDGLRGVAIPLAARIVALADFYDALTSNRCYRAAVDHTDTCRMIEEASGSHFDPDIVSVFKTMENQFRHIRQDLQDRHASQSAPVDLDSLQSRAVA